MPNMRKLDMQFVESDDFDKFELDDSDDMLEFFED